MSVNYYEEILDEAYAAASTAAEAKYLEIGERDCCGFAWVLLPRAMGGLSAHCRKKIKEAGKMIADPREKKMAEQKAKQRYGDKHYRKGWQFRSPAKHRTQSMSVHEAGAKAFAAVLKKNGIEAYMQSRMD